MDCFFRRVSPSESENANTGISSRFDEEEISYTPEELALKCDILERTNLMLEERIVDLEEKNCDLVQANVLLLKENEQMKSDLERQKKEFLIKTTAARKVSLKVLSSFHSCLYIIYLF